MADVNATFNYDADFGSALSQIKALSKELSVLNNSFNSLDKNARVLRNDIANTFTSAVGQIGGFSSKTVTITSDLDNFGKSLDKSKLKLRDYYREATRAFSANSNARKLAEDQVRRTKGQLVELGMDAEGRRKGILVTPMRLDMTDMNNQLQVARKQFDIFNRLIQDGATSLINWGKNTQWAGRQLTVGLTVPMTIFATTTIKAFNDVDRELTRFQKVYGSDLVGTTTEATNAIRQQIQLLAIDIAKQYGIAAKETAGLAADLAATGLEGKKLTDSIKETTRLAVLGELDRQDAMATTLSLQNAFNMSTQELAESIDFLNAVENQTSVSLQDLTVAIPKVGPVVESLGGDVKDLSVLLVAMKEGGINAAEGANALKSGLASLINPTKSASAIAKQYGIDLQGIVTRNKGQLMPTLLEFQASLQTLDDFGKAKIIEQLFGKYQFARISALFDNLNAQGSQTVEVMKLMGASSAELAEIADAEIKTLTESTSMRFQRAMEGIKASLLPVGETITRAVIPFMEKFAEIMGKIVDIGKGLPEPVKNFLKFATGLTAVAGPLVMITGVLANFLGYVTKGAMGFVNLGRRLAGLPTNQFSLLDDQQIAAAKATDTLTVSIQNQASAMTRLVQLMRDYNSTLIAQKSATPGAFTSTPLVNPPRRGGKPPPGTPIRRQQGSWVPGSGSGDKVKALLEPGEFVVNRNAAKQYGGLLENINNETPRFQSGGPLKAVLGIKVPFQRVSGPGAFSMSTKPVKPESRAVSRPIVTMDSIKTKKDLMKVIESGQIDDIDVLEELAKSVGVRVRKDATSSPLPQSIKKRFTNFSWSSKDEELRIIREAGLGGEALYMSQAHIAPATYTTAAGENYKIWKTRNLTPDLQFINNRIMQMKKPALQAAGITNHPTTEAEYRKLRDVLMGMPGDRDAEVAIKIINLRLNSDYFSKSSSFRSEIASVDEIGITSQTWKERYKKEKSARDAQKLSAQGGAWVPGEGTGDRIPALLEPGEFVVNKKAAKQYGGMLEDINFNQAPRFQMGGMSGKQRVSAGTGAVGMMAMMLPALSPTNEALSKFGTTVSTAMFSISALTGVMDMFGKKLNAQSMSGLLERGAAKRAVGQQGLRVGANMGGIRGAGIAAQGAGRLAMGSLMSGPGIALVAAVALGAAAWMKYKKEVEEARKATEQAFSVGKKTAQAYGYELTKISEKLKENAELTKQIGINSSAVTSSIIVDEEKKAAILADNAELIADLQEKQNKLLGVQAAQTQYTVTLPVTPTTRQEAVQVGTGPLPNTRESAVQENTRETAVQANTTVQISNASEQIKSQLLTKYATLRQQGVSVQDANEIIRVIAMEAGDETISALLDLKPTLEKMNTDNINEVFKAAQKAQLESLKNIDTGSTGGGEAFREAITASMDVIQYAPPEDQLLALNNLITNMRGFDSDQLVLASQALADAAATNYGTKSGIGQALQTLFKSGNVDQIALGAEIDTLLKSNAITENQKLEIQIAVASGDIDKVNSIIDPILKDRNLKINITVQTQKDAQNRIEEINKEITAQQAKFDGQMVANDSAVEAEKERYESAQKAHEKFIKQKQDEIEAINKSADAYIKALQDEQRADDFAQQQRDTAVGGLKALASGDVFGFVQSQQEMAGSAQQFGFESEIKAIDERRQAAVDAKQEEIEKQQELAATEDERHQNRLKALEAQRVAQIQVNGDIMKGFQGQQAALEQLSTSSGAAYDSIVEGFAKVDIEANKVGATSAAVNYLLVNPKATVEEAIAAGRKFMESKAQSPGANYQGAGGYYGSGPASPTSGGESKGGYAMGGYISGAGGPKSDLIPARLSNGEYVVQASAVDQYGVGMMNAINEQKFADGGLVLDPSTKSKIGMAEKEWGERFNIVKGGYLKPDKYSGSTHTGGGVFDAYYDGGSKLFPVAAVKALRKAGFAAWNRWQFGANNKHIHAIEIGNPKLSESAIAQVRAYQRGEDGLGGKDTLSNDYKIDSGSTSVIPDEVAPNLDKIAKAMGTTAEAYNQVKNEGVASLIGRKFGGSMTMNKPYMVGENGPEIVMPYGSGGKVVPIKYNVPAMASGGIMNGNMVSTAPQINVTVNGVNDPKQAADRAAQLINSEMNRRMFSRSIG
jgi:TP901 family phage tail tape measure protein